MATHYLDRPLDSSFESFQKRLGSNQLRTPELNHANRYRLGLPQQPLIREGFIGDRIGGVSKEEWSRRVSARKQQRIE